MKFLFSSRFCQRNSTEYFSGFPGNQTADQAGTVDRKIRLALQNIKQNSVYGLAKRLGTHGQCHDPGCLLYTSSGIFCAYELSQKKADLKILMIEKGRRIEDRSCPKRKTKVCVGCKPCSITTGFAGAGAFSDGKLSLSPDVGGNLPQILGYEETEQLLKESDQIYLKFGADTKVYGLNEEKEIARICGRFPPTSGEMCIRDRSRESPIERIGFPNACRKILTDFWIQHNTMVQR